MPKVHEITDIDNVLGRGLAQGDSSQTTTSGIKDTISLAQLALGQIDNIDLMTCDSDDITAHVPMSLKQKNWKNQYINIALLLKGSPELIDICSGGNFRLNENGILESKPVMFKEKVHSIEKWADAFLIYMHTYLQKHFDKASEMLQYMATIRDAASRNIGYGWRVYDEQFRMRQSLELKSGSQLNSDLWLKVMTPTTAGTFSNMPQRRQFASQPSPLACTGYNKGSCK